MPEISRFYGIVIRMYFDDHNPPHFHAAYGNSEVLININTLATIAGNIPPRAMSMVSEWTALHQTELQGLWQKAENYELLGKIDPLA